jgi:hypothetical protein
MNADKLNQYARAAYLQAAKDSSLPWDELPEWIRESWRQEVDPDRDPDLIRQARAEQAQ